MPLGRGPVVAWDNRKAGVCRQQDTAGFAQTLIRVFAVVTEVRGGVVRPTESVERVDRERGGRAGWARGLAKTSKRVRRLELDVVRRGEARRHPRGLEDLNPAGRFQGGEGAERFSRVA